jgi:hypothetical protein
MAKTVILLAIGLLVTIVTGWFCECFLKRSVRAPKSPHLQEHQVDAGGKQLGVLERLLFFASLWRDQYLVIGGAWLVFKAAGKWAAWQHIARLPDTQDMMEDRIIASSRLLGRFFNGTLYNALCASLGIGTQKLVQHVWDNQLFSLTTDCTVWCIIVILLLGVSLFRDWPSFCEDKKQSDQPQTVASKEPPKPESTPPGKGDA